MKKKVISMLLTLAMVGSLAACGDEKPVSQESTPTAVESNVSTEATSETPSEVEVKEPVTITLMPANANLTSGVVGGWVGEFLAEHGIILDVWAYSADKVNAIMASGDYPDVMFFPKATDFNVLAEEGYLLDLNEYMDKIPALELEENAPALNYVNEYIIDESDKLVVLPTNVGEAAPKMNTGGQALALNWEVYEQIGSPEINSWEDTIEVFKQMQEAWPVSDTGVKTYAMHLYGGDGEYFLGASNLLKLSGYTVDWLKWFMVGNTRTNEFEYMLEDDGIYKYALSYYNTLYREGLLDPDSITYDRKAVIAIVDTEGSTLAGWPNVPAYERKGFMPLYFDGMRLIYNTTSKPYGGGSMFIGISSKCENVDTALAFLNLLADPDSALVFRSGPEGELWELDASGTAVLTEKGKKFYVDGEAVTINGEAFALFNTMMMAHAGRMTSYGKNAQAANWPEVLSAQNATEVVSKWQKHYNASDFKELLGEDLVKVSFDQNLNMFVEAPSEEEQLLFTAAQEIIINASWKMVYAESDAEFEKLWDDAVAECEELGVKKLAESRLEALATAAEVRDAMNK